MRIPLSATLLLVCASSQMHAVFKNEGKEETKRVESSASSSSYSAPPTVIEENKDPIDPQIAIAIEATRSKYRNNYRQAANIGALAPGGIGASIVDQAFVETLFRNGDVLVCDLGNAENEGFRLHMISMYYVWGMNLEWAKAARSADPISKEQFMSGLAALLPEDRLPLPLSPMRVRRTNPGVNPSPIVGYTVVWSPTFQHIIIGQVSTDDHFQEKFWWLTDTDGGRLTPERVHAILNPLIHHRPPESKDHWVSFSVPPADEREGLVQRVFGFEVALPTPS